MPRIAFIVSIAALLGSALAIAHLDHNSWPQWGGHEGNFQAHPVELSDKWGDDGPPVVWRRELGDGNSAISVKGRRLFTMYRRGEEEVAVALHRATGETLWEQAWRAEPWKNFLKDYGLGPHVTPLVTGDRVFTVGISGKLVALEANTGDILWAYNLWQGYTLDPDAGGPQQLGYSASPVLHRHMVIAVGGASSRAVVALDIDSGKPIWTAQGFEPSFASPTLITVGDQLQLVVFASDRVVGLDPETGKQLWEFEHRTPYNVNASTPLWDGEDLLFISSAYDAGSRALRIRQVEGKTQVEEAWSSRKIEVHHQTSVLIDGRIYASSGDFGPAFLTAINPADGSLLFRDRGFAKANLLAVGHLLLILDEDGNLALGAAGAEGIDIRARTQLFKSRAWTVPTLVGTTLYARDRHEIVAVELAPPG